jgi:hypothetical protein
MDCAIKTIANKRLVISACMKDEFSKMKYFIKVIANSVADTINAKFAEIDRSLAASSSVSETTINVSILNVATGIKIAVTESISVK